MAGQPEMKGANPSEILQDFIRDVIRVEIEVVLLALGLQFDHLRDQIEGFHQRSDHGILDRILLIELFGGRFLLRDGEKDPIDQRGYRSKSLARRHGQAERFRILQFAENQENDVVRQAIEEIVGTDHFLGAGIGIHHQIR